MSNVTAVGAALAVAVGFPCPGLAANELLRNGSFEDVCDGKTVGWQIGRHWRFADGCGMNGTRGLAFENLDEKDFYEYPSQGVAFEKGTRYQFSAMVRTEDLNGCVGLCVEWYDAAGKWISGAYKAGLRGTHDWTKFEGATPPIPSEAEKIRFAFFVSKGGFGRVWFDDVSVRPLCRPVFGGLYTSAYRNLQKSGRIRFQAAVNCAEHPRAKAYFTYRDAGCAERRVRATKMTASAASLDLDAAHLAYGTHPVRCELVDGDGAKLGDATLDFTRPHELPARRTWIDSRGRTIVDGKPFFPIGIYLASLPMAGTHFDDFRTGPFNCVMPYNCDRAGLNLCRNAGIEVIYPLNSCWPWHRCRPKGVETDAEADAWVEKSVTELKDHPAVLAWYVNDEISIEKFPQLLARQKLLERIDPGHPTWTVLYQFGEVRSYYPTFDVVGTDPYPVPEAPIGNVAMMTRTTRDETMGLKPMWQVPQAFAWQDCDPKRGAVKGRFPTREEMVNMTWQCVANGANGIVYWCYRLLYQKGKFRVDRWADICAAAASIKAYQPIFLSDEDEPPVEGVGEFLSARAWRYQDRIYLAVVNNTRTEQKGLFGVGEKVGGFEVLQDAAAGSVCVENGKVNVVLNGLGHVLLQLDAVR